MYTYTLDARDNSSELRGIWRNSTSQQDATNVWTLSVPPTGVSVTASATNPPTGSTITWTAVGGFGPGTIEYYRYTSDRPLPIRGLKQRRNGPTVRWQRSLLQPEPGICMSKATMVKT